jgi:hypothetical protein
MKNNRKAWRVAALIAVGILLILISSSLGEKRNESKTAEVTLEAYKESLERELVSLCSDIDGVGKCRVFITFERGALNTYKGSAVVETKPPRVLGVTVVCRGADSDSVRGALIDMITALFGIGSNRVAVLKLNS